MADHTQAQSGEDMETNDGSHIAGASTDKPLQTGRRLSGSTVEQLQEARRNIAAHPSAGQKGPGVGRRAKPRGPSASTKSMISEASSDARELASTVPVSHDSNRPRVLEVRRPKQQYSMRHEEVSCSRDVAKSRAEGVHADADSQQRQLHT